ncbi:MAG TPA: hypothetical protein PK095_23230, partial [Myxococcota bacterium]|nr:hypothetical protein [Myxococcota bacterium]
ALSLSCDTPEGLSDAELERLMPERVPTASGLPRPPSERRDPRVTIETEGAPSPKPPARSPASIGPDELEQVLASFDYRLSLAADHFGISRPTMNELVDKHPRLKRAQRLSADEIRAALATSRTGGTPAWRLLAVSERGLRLRMRELGLQ